jgi:hypothetical protein
MTLAQLQTEVEVALPHTRHYRINLPITEANQSLKVNLASFLKPKNKLVDMLPKVDTDARSFALVYVPFIEEHNQYIQPELQFAINKNILTLSEHF